MTSPGCVIRRGAVALGAGVAALMLSAGPVYAHYATITIDSVGLASINSGHTAVSVCKQSTRYERARVQVTRNGTTHSVSDYSVSDGCKTLQITVGSDESFRLCGLNANNTGVCSSWRDV